MERRFVITLATMKIQKQQEFQVSNDITSLWITRIVEQVSSSHSCNAVKRVARDMGPCAGMDKCRIPAL